jgi:hypothetical protein
MDPVPSYDDLIWLFEAEPVYRYEDDEREAGYEFDWRELWPYTAVTFHTRRAGYDVEMYIEPGYEVVRLRLRSGPEGAELLDLDLTPKSRTAPSSQGCSTTLALRVTRP